MKWREWLDNWSMTSLKVKTPFLESEWMPKDADKDAAWEMYVELLTRSTTQRLMASHGNEGSSLESIYKLFDITRGVMKQHGRLCIEFSKLAAIVLNQKIRPFTTKWHARLMEGAFDDEASTLEFRRDLEELQKVLITFTKMLADMAEVEDLSEMEN